LYDFTIEVLHDEKKIGAKSKCIGVVTIPLALAKLSEVDEWFSLEKVKDKDKVSGTLHVNIKYIPPGTPGLELVDNNKKSKKHDKRRMSKRLTAEEAAELSELTEDHSEMDHSEASESVKSHRANDESHADDETSLTGDKNIKGKPPKKTEDDEGEASATRKKTRMSVQIKGAQDVADEGISTNGKKGKKKSSEDATNPFDEPKNPFDDESSSQASSATTKKKKSLNVVASSSSNPFDEVSTETKKKKKEI